MENEFTDLESVDCLRLWQSNRAYSNESSNRILITKPIQNLISMIEDRFVTKKKLWDCKLVNGLSGCGKSIAFTLCASFLVNHGFKVYWFRDGKAYTPWHAKKFLSKSHSDPFTIVFIDQIDKSYDHYSILRHGDRVLSCAFVGCGSGNLTINRSSSETIIIGETYEFEPCLPFSSFKVLFPSLTGNKF
jgi:hypothetical protein